MKNKKKFIALLTLCCAATAVAALVGCGGKDGADGANGLPGINGSDGAPGKSAYEIAVENGYTGTEEEFAALLTHQHDYSGDVIVIKEATGVDEGVGYVTCPTDGAVKIVSIPVVAGIIKENPMEIAPNTTETIKINKYDSDRYGAHPDKGEYGVMYFKTAVEGSGLYSMQIDAGEGVNVEYQYYYDENYESVRDYRSMDGTYGGDVTYVKAIFTGDFDAATVSTKLTTVPETGIENTISLSQGTATGLKLYEWGTIWNEDYTESHEGWTESYMEEYKPAQSDNPATEENEAMEEVYGNYRKNEDGSFRLNLSYAVKFKIEVEGLGEEYYVANPDDLIIEYPIDGSKDAGVNLVVQVGKLHAFSFTAKDKDGQAIKKATIQILDGNGTVVETLTADDEGKATATLKELPDGTFNYVASIATTDILLESEMVALDLATKDVVINQKAKEIPEWATDGTQYNVEEGVALGKVTLTADQAGKYIVTLACEDDWFAMENYTLTVNGEAMRVGGVGFATEFTVTVTLNEGVNTILFEGFYPAPMKISVTASSSGGATEAPVGTLLVLDTAVKAVADADYIFQAPEAGTYVFNIAPLEGKENCYVAIWNDSASSYNSFPFFEYSNDTKSFSRELQKDEWISFYTWNDDCMITVTKGVGEGEDETPSKDLEIGVAKEIEGWETYTFTSTADVEKVYVVTITAEGNTSSLQGIVVGSDYDNYNSFFSYDSFNDSDKTLPFTFEVTVAAGAAQDFYVEYTADNSTTVYFTVTLKDAK